LDTISSQKNNKKTIIMATLSIPNVGGGVASGAIRLGSIAPASIELTRDAAGDLLAELENDSYNRNKAMLPARLQNPAPERKMEPLQIGGNQKEYTDAELIARGLFDKKATAEYRKGISDEERKAAELKDSAATITFEKAVKKLASDLDISEAEVKALIEQDNKTLQLESTVARTARYTGLAKGVNAHAYATLLVDGKNTADGVIRQVNKKDNRTYNALIPFNMDSPVIRYLSTNDLFASLLKVGIKNDADQAKLTETIAKKARQLLPKVADDLIAYAIKTRGIVVDGNKVTEATAEMKTTVARALAGYLSEVNNLPDLPGKVGALKKTIENSKGNVDVIASAVAEMAFSKRFQTNAGEFDRVLNSPSFQGFAKGYYFVNLKEHASYQALYEPVITRDKSGRANLPEPKLADVRGVKGSTPLALFAKAQTVTDFAKKNSAIKTLEGLGLKHFIANAHGEFHKLLLAKVPKLEETFSKKETKAALVQTRSLDAVRQAVQIAGEKGYIRAFKEVDPKHVADAEKSAELMLKEAIKKDEQTIAKLESASEPQDKADNAQRVSALQERMSNPLIKDSFLTIVTAKTASELIYKKQGKEQEEVEQSMEEEMDRDDT
jgi:ribosomal protein S8